MLFFYGSFRVWVGLSISQKDDTMWDVVGGSRSTVIIIYPSLPVFECK